jgi:transcriptional regulator GlxA family with amidase domain
LRNTQLPIKTIAAQVGVSDPRLFNKLIHKSLGASPQEVRRR